ncbi:MAG TPA: porin [Thiotrichales bacterium]|nr:porin [Thiotrichales bacterium]
MNHKPAILSAALMALLGNAPLAAAGETEALQKEVERLKKQNELIMERLEATADMLESMQDGTAAAEETTAGSHDHSMATSGSMRDRTFGIHGQAGTTTVGAYGEMHYNNLKNNSGGSDKKEMDFHRFILFMGHEFTDSIRFWSELEVEHAFVEPDGGGEVAIEQAFLEFDLNPDLAARAGILLVPVGFINETHEPPTFYGVERPNVDKYILPTTWREGGAGLAGRFGQGFSYDVLVHTGLNITDPGFAVRGGRTGVGNAPASDLAATARLNWAGVPGLLIGGTVQYQSDVTQGNNPNAGSATLVSGHLSWQVSRFTLRGVYATWDLSGSAPAAVGADQQTGWYLEPSWKFTEKFGVFARYSDWDNSVNADDTGNTQVDAGFNFWPHENVVLKFDYQDMSVGANSPVTEYDGFNLGIGYMF